MFVSSCAWAWLLKSAEKRRGVCVIIYRSHLACERDRLSRPAHIQEHISELRWKQNKINKQKDSLSQIKVYKIQGYWDKETSVKPAVATAWLPVTHLRVMKEERTIHSIGSKWTKFTATWVEKLRGIFRAMGESRVIKWSIRNYGMM